MIHPDFPRTQLTPFIPTSPQTQIYNCIAWAYGIQDRWLWPDPLGIYFWPTNLQRVETLQNFIRLFQGIGYEVCTSEMLEPGFEKVSIFADAFGKPTHAARQLPTGQWTSKLGGQEDVTHDYHNIQGGSYGHVTVVMRRPNS